MRKLFQIRKRMARNKYGSKPAEEAGRSFQSQGERDCFRYLKLLERAGEIDSIECQVTSHLTSGVTHKTDFKVFDLKLGEAVFIEYKGFVNDRWRVIKKLWRTHGPGRLRVYAGYGLRMRMIEEIIPDGEKK